MSCSAHLTVSDRKIPVIGICSGKSFIEGCNAGIVSSGKQNLRDSAKAMGDTAKTAASPMVFSYQMRLV